VIRPAARPRLTCWSNEAPDVVVKRFNEALVAERGAIGGQALPGFVNLWPADRDRSFFSPYLSLEVRPQGEGSVATGRFGPHPAVWTGFMFVYAVLSLGGVLALMFGWAQSIADEPPWMLWGAPASVALILFIYGAEYIGKGLGSEQMHAIAHFVARVVPVTQFPAPLGQEASPPPPGGG
jgi:hypothetical protein